VKQYIKNQDEHHKRKSFQEEYDEWSAKYMIKNNPNKFGIDKGEVFIYTLINQGVF